MRPSHAGQLFGKFLISEDKRLEVVAMLSDCGRLEIPVGVGLMRDLALAMEFAMDGSEAFLAHFHATQPPMRTARYITHR